MNDARRRLLYLGLGEWAAGFCFVFLFAAWQHELSVGTAAQWALALLVFVLGQGGTYWLIRYRSLSRREPIGRNVVNLFTGLRYIDRLLLLGVPVAILAAYEGTPDLLFAIACYLFAAAEYVNYYEFRLSYGKSGFNVKKLRNTGLRRSSLHRLLRKERSKNPYRG